MKAKAFLFDVTKCILCGACWAADKGRNKLPITVPEEKFTEDKLSAKSFLVINNFGDRGVRFSCMHCLTPSCASSCPVQALEKMPIGAVVYHQEKCIGCRYCIIACPFGIPKYEWQKPLPYVRKCDFCYSRISEGKLPACSEACPAEALIFGNRDDLLQEAHERINDDSRYVKHIYGENEVGGTSLLIISDISMEKLGYPAGLTTSPIPNLTWEALEKVPNVVLLGGTLLTGLWWITKRREEVLKAEGKWGKQNEQ